MAPPLLCSPPPGREGTGLGNTRPFSTDLKTGNVGKAGEIQTHRETFRRGEGGEGGWGVEREEKGGSGRVDGTREMAVK